MQIKYFYTLKLNGGYTTPFFESDYPDESGDVDLAKMKKVITAHVKLLYEADAINYICKAAYFIGSTDNPFDYINIPMD